MPYHSAILAQLVKHPDYKTYPAQEKAVVKANAKVVMERTEKLKKALKARYEDEFKLWTREEEERKRRLAEERKRKQVGCLRKYLGQRTM